MNVFTRISFIFAIIFSNLCFMKSEEKFEKLIRAASEMRKFSQAKYSDFTVGAALLTTDGEIITGCNVESSSFGLTICAERVALTKALSEGKTKFSHIAIVGPANDYCPPCGACRQLLYDYAPDILVIMINKDTVKIMPLKDLLPLAFEETQLRKS
jgi:cytidine deaminase